jgi:hypothetical protein
MDFTVLTRIGLMKSTSEIVLKIQRAIQNRLPLKSVVGLITDAGGNSTGLTPSELRDFVFVSARVHKMCDKFKRDRDSIRASTERASSRVGSDWGDTSGAIAQYAWALGTIGVAPSCFPSDLSQTVSHRTPSKDLCNTLWALSKWDKPESVALFDSTCDLIDASRVQQLSDADIVAILRGIATVHEYR